MTDCHKFVVMLSEVEMLAIDPKDESYIVRNYITPQIDLLRGRYKVGDYRVFSEQDPITKFWTFDVLVDIDPLPGVCQNCGRPIQVMAFYTTKWCSDDCRKVIQGEDSSENM